MWKENSSTGNLIVVDVGEISNIQRRTSICFSSTILFHLAHNLKISYRIFSEFLFRRPFLRKYLFNLVRWHYYSSQIPLLVLPCCIYTSKWDIERVKPRPQGSQYMFLILCWASQTNTCRCIYPTYGAELYRMTRKRNGGTDMMWRKLAREK